MRWGSDTDRGHPDTRSQIKRSKKTLFLVHPVDSIFRPFEPFVASALNMTYYGGTDTWCIYLPSLDGWYITVLGMEHACSFPVHMCVPVLFRSPEWCHEVG